jgi:hypothetical protein
MIVIDDTIALEINFPDRQMVFFYKDEPIKLLITDIPNENFHFFVCVLFIFIWGFFSFLDV